MVIGTILPMLLIEKDLACQLQANGDVLVGCFRFNGPLRQYFSLYRAVFSREKEK